jgi:hypothetical protein
MIGSTALQLSTLSCFLLIQNAPGLARQAPVSDDVADILALSEEYGRVFTTDSI